MQPSVIFAIIHDQIQLTDVRGERKAEIIGGREELVLPSLLITRDVKSQWE
jgi:hypothetical protein